MRRGVGRADPDVMDVADKVVKQAGEEMLRTLKQRQANEEPNKPRNPFAKLADKFGGFVCAIALHQFSNRVYLSFFRA